jgi:beta-glucosidase
LISEAKTDKASYKKDDVITITCEIQNTGKEKGAEVIQIYVNDVKSSVLRPLKELKAFKKVLLNADETTTVSLEIPVKDLAFFDDSNMDWKLEEGQFKLLIGTSSTEIKKTILIEVK